MMLKLSELYTERLNLEKAKSNRPNDPDIKWELEEIEKDIRAYEKALSSRSLLDDTDYSFMEVV